ncbi:general transcription factor 3C polypeptide 1 [Carassius auratus]|uniref:General transcription factor 3C polypeptide 1 n=2 Tax=Carassius auratus TaxID=7957 RepID=A0A6P6PJV8_CARAU|nr:general transcription factor 3C polypeptide 1 [Carassius auratus]
MMMMDPLDAVLDEVALEGLDGISIQTLWLRLRSRQPEFGLNLDPLSQQFIWSCLIRAPEIRFYLLPENRRTVTLRDRFVEVDRDTGIHEMQEADPVDVYPVSVVTEDPAGVQGSCLFFSEREDVSDQIRSADPGAPLTLEQVQSRWSERLVLVASQEQRYRALIGAEGNPELKLPDLCYCILERLGRARWQGELQRDLHTRIFRMDAGKMHYLRRKLDKVGLITLQSHVARLPSGAQQHSLLLLLKRFHVDRRSKYDILMESTSRLLSELPEKTGIMVKLRDQLRVSDRTFKRVYQYMLAAKMVSVVRIALKELDPGGGPFKTQRGTEVFVRCLKLVKPYGQKEAEEDEDDENNDEDGDASAKRNVLGEPRIIERDMLTQAYDIVVSTGTRGISQSVLRGRLNIGKLEGRMICRLLERINMIKGFMEDEGRQRTTKYISKLFVEQSQLNQQFTKERQRSQHLRVTHLAEPQEQEVQETPQKTHTPQQLKQSKLSFKKQPAPPKKKPPAREGGAKASPKAEPVDSAPSTSASQSQQPENTQPVIEEVLTEKPKKVEIHETYRLLKRKNMIIETVRCSKIIEGFYTLQKLLTEEEKKDGINTKVCKKSVVRLTRSLSREGLLKLYRTIVIQDGVQKKVEFVVHPSVTPDDPLVKSAIDQIRLRMSSSASGARVEPPPEKPKPSAPEEKENKASRASKNSGLRKVSEQMGVKALKSFRPVLVPGLGRSMGFLPKMPRLRMVHSFLWYLIHAHPLRQCDPEAPPPPGEDACATEDQFKVYVKENSWKRYVPPIPLHKDYGFGWALISDVLVSLPLSVLVQVVQVNYQVEGLDEYLKDPVKQHYLIRFLPSEIKRQLLHRRKYIFSFHESLQRLCFMGLLQFGPTEKFMDKDQVFVFLKSKASIVDTTVCDPHYNLAIESLRPFERRHYVFKSAQDVENYWFDLLCVCLNTPLGVARQRPSEGAAETEESDVVMATESNSRLLYTLQGSCEVVDDGVTPGDGHGAGGLDSSFYSHLKRNWTWTSHLMNPSKQSTGTQEIGTHHTVRLRNLLSKLPPPKPATLTAAQSGVKVAPPAVLEEEVRTSSEPSSRNQEVRGGRNLKRKRDKKESSKPPCKKKRVRASRRSQAQDETDRHALLQMTRQRVTWTHMEDSLLMLCRVASHFLNRKLKRPFVPWTVVRDVLHAEFELSLDKTSLSVSRRARYIMRNPQTCLNYRICLAEMYQDKELMGKFMNRTGDYNDVKVCALEYKEFVRSLRTKFSSSYGSSDVIIPDTREQLFNKFKVFAIGDGSTERTKDIIKSTEDIHVLVLFNLIQSTLVLTNAQMKNYRPFQTFCLYTHYREEVLCEAFQTCRNRALVNRRRPTSVYGLKKSHVLPFLPMSYQLSQHYYKFFTWRFPSTIYNEAFDLLTGLSEAGRGDRDSRFSFQKEPDTEEDEDETQGMLQFPMDAPGGASACCLTLMTLGLLSVDVSIPQQIVVVDSTMMDSEVVKSLTRALEEEEEEEESDRKRRLEVKPTQASHTNYLLMRGYYTPILRSQTHNSNSTDSIMVNTCNVHLRLRQTPAHTLFSSSAAALSALSPCTPPSLPPFFTRTYRSAPVDLQLFLERCVSLLGYGAQDVQALTEITRAVEEGAEFGVDRQDLCERFIHLDQPEDGRSRTLLQYIQDLVDGEQLVEAGALSQRLVCAEAASHWLLHTRCESVQIQQASPTRSPAPDSAHDTPPPTEGQPVESELQETVTEDPVSMDTAVNQTVAMEPVSTDTAENRSVSMELDAEEVVAMEEVVHKDDGGSEQHISDDKGVGLNTSPAPSPMKDGAEGAADLDTHGSLRFVSRPWRVVDGSLNRPVCKGMLESLLLHIMSSPALLEAQLLQHYSQVLQPVVVLELLQVLVDVGCVKKRYTIQQHKPSLFSKPRAPQVKGQAEVSLRDAGTVFYEPTVDCVLRLARVFPHELNWNRWVQLCLRS